MIYSTKLAEGGLGGNKRPRKRPSDLGLGYSRLTGMDVCKVSLYVYGNMCVWRKNEAMCKTKGEVSSG